MESAKNGLHLLPIIIHLHELFSVILINLYKAEITSEENLNKQANHSLGSIKNQAGVPTSRIEMESNNSLLNKTTQLVTMNFIAK